MALSSKYQLKNRFLLSLFCSVLPVFIHLSVDFWISIYYFSIIIKFSNLCLWSSSLL